MFSLVRLYVPSHRRDIRWLFDHLTPVGKGDVVLDLGSGDGIVLREVSRRGARAVGYELHPVFVAIARLASWGDRQVQVRWANIWTAPFPDDVTLVYAFSVGRDGARLAKKMQQEADRAGRSLSLVCYGNALPGRTPTAAEGAYFVYRFEPLHLG